MRLDGEFWWASIFALNLCHLIHLTMTVPILGGLRGIGRGGGLGAIYLLNANDIDPNWPVYNG